MDFTNENSPVPLSFWIGQPEARESFGPQVNIATIAYFGQFHISGNMGHTESEGHGPTEDWNESTVCKYHGSLS